MKCPSYNLFFETVSNKSRMKILQFLKNKPMNVTELCNALKEEQSKVSHNLRKLADCHLIDMKKDGKNRVYSLNKETMIPLMSLVEKHVNKYCCKSCGNYEKKRIAEAKA